MSEKTTFLGALKTAAYTTIASALVAWIGGFLPAPWSGLQAFGAWELSVALYQVSVPAALLVALVMGTLWAAVNAGTSAAPISRPEPPDEEGLKLTDLETRMMRLLAQADGKLIHFEDAAVHLHEAELLLSQACDSLHEKGLLKPDLHPVRSTRLSLTRSGRDYIIEQGFALGGLQSGW